MLATAMDGTAWVGSCNTKDLAQQLVVGVQLLEPHTLHVAFSFSTAGGCTV